MKTINEMALRFPSKSCNEAFARAAVSAFIAVLDPTVGELSDLKTAVSEAVTNCVVHGYRRGAGKGVGITDVKQAMEPLFTTAAEEERAGLGFAVMQSFCDKVRVSSKPGKGTTVTLEKRIADV